MSSTDTGSTVTNGLAIKRVSIHPVPFTPKSNNVLRDGELSQIVTNHLGLDFDLVEFLARVDTDDGADHLRDNNHVTEVGLDEVGLLVGAGLLLGLAELLDQAHGLALQAAVEPSAGAGVDDIAELFRREVEEPVFSLIGSVVGGRSVHGDVLVEVNSSVGKLAELAALLDLWIAGLLAGCLFACLLSLIPRFRCEISVECVISIAGFRRREEKVSNVPAASSAFCKIVSIIDQSLQWCRRRPGQG